jgi:glutamate synthase (NADPH/NADH) large chain
MSGGYAYVLDLDPGVVNGEMVDVSAVPVDEADRLHEIVREHARRTDSGVAHALLADWSAALPRFSSLVARDFRKVLEATRRARASGEDVDEAVMAAARV